jgi:hypothetical protein
MTEEYREKLRKKLEEGKIPANQPQPTPKPVVKKNRDVKKILKHIFNENWDHTLKEEQKDQRFVAISGDKNYPQCNEYWEKIIPYLRSAGCKIEATSAKTDKFLSEKGGIKITLVRDSDKSNKPGLEIKFGHSDYVHETDYVAVEEFFTDLGMGVEDKIPVDGGIVMFVVP